MGICQTTELPPEERLLPKFQRIRDNYETLEEVSQALRQAGLESCQLIVGIDFTKSNTWSGERTFGGRCLHDVNGPPNPYLISLSLVARTLADFDDDNLIPAYGFGDVSTREDSVFSLLPRNQPLQGLDSLLMTYRQISPLVQLSGPTSFGPLVRQAMREVFNSGMQFTMLLILADGQISERCMNETTSAIIAASSLPLAIVMIGVGDGPWDTMRKFDDELTDRKWDNFQFVEFDKLNNKNLTDAQREANFALHALMELPDQYKLAENLMGFANRDRVANIIHSIPAFILRDPPYRTIPNPDYLTRSLI